jgi:hypothetical protein
LAKKEYPRLTGFFSKRKRKTKTKRKRKANKKSNLRKYEVCHLEIIAKEEKQIFALERLIWLSSKELFSKIENKLKLFSRKKKLSNFKEYLWNDFR